MFDCEINEICEKLLFLDNQPTKSTILRRLFYTGALYSYYRAGLLNDEQNNIFISSFETLKQYYNTSTNS